MILPRSHTWMHLLPEGASFVFADNVPGWLRSPVESRGRAGGRRFRLDWKRPRSERPSLNGYDGAVAVNGGGRDVDRFRAAGFVDVRRFAALPSLRNARWFIPLDSPAVSSGAFCLYTPFRMSAKLTYFAIQAAIRTRLPLWYRDTVLIAQRGLSPKMAALQALFPGRRVALALSSGAIGPDARRKPSIALLDDSGRPLAFAKVAGSDVATVLLQHEAGVLPALARRPDLVGRVPRLLLSGEVDGASLVVQSPVPGRSIGARWTPSHAAFLATLRGRELKPAASSAMFANLRNQARARPDLRAILDHVGPILESTEVPATITHTDFVPWNLRSDRGVLAAFDWDTAEIDGLPLLDELHYHLMVGYCIAHWSAGRAVDYLAGMASTAPLGLEPREVRSLQVVYLIHGILRMLIQGHPDDHPMVAWYRHLLGSAHAACAGGTPRPDRALASCAE